MPLARVGARTESIELHNAQREAFARTRNNIKSMQYAPRVLHFSAFHFYGGANMIFLSSGADAHARNEMSTHCNARCDQPTTARPNTKLCCAHIKGAE